LSVLACTSFSLFNELGEKSRPEKNNGRECKDKNF
jgi:hypothetical protein